MLSAITTLQVKTAYELDFCKVFVYDYFMLSVINEGVLLDKDKCEKIIEIAHKHFKQDIPFAYLTIRSNSYSVDPTVYFKVRSLKNLKAFAVISNKEIDFYNFKIENFFYKRNMKIFFDKKSALIWINKVMGIENCF